MEHVQSALKSVKLPAHLSAEQSFQIGAAITAATARIEELTIQTVDRWHSSSYILYNRIYPCHIASLLSTLARCLSNTWKSIPISPLSY